MNTAPRTDEIAAYLETIGALVDITTASIRRDIAFSILCCNDRDRSVSETHGQLGRKYGFDKANAIYPEATR